jgi:SH3-like domain-containing protein
VFPGSITKVSVAAALLLLCGCSKGPPRAQPLGEAFVGPATLKIRSDIPLQSSAVTTVKHGDRLAILQTRRRFLRVRTPSGAEGWTDERQLLASGDMEALRALTAHAARLPSQGVAAAYAPLNIHTQPVLSSPSFLQLKENEKFDVLQSIVLTRSDVPRKSLIPPAPKKLKPLPRKEARKPPQVPPPPMPKPPALPPDWLELSKTDRDEAAADADQIPPRKLAPRVDGWSLIRAPSGQSGWVLTRLVSMAIPDDVAQYAEGRRIVSYFPLGDIQDGDLKKNIWLWTTTADSKQPWDFDSFRVFVWSLRRHRYETGYIERNLKGYSPVLLKEVELTSKSGASKYPGFSICLEKKDGQRVRREFALLGVAIRFSGDHPCEAPPPPPTLQNPSPLPVSELPPPQPKPGLAERLKQHWHALTGK